MKGTWADGQSACPGPSLGLLQMLEVTSLEIKVLCLSHLKVTWVHQLHQVANGDVLGFGQNFTVKSASNHTVFPKKTQSHPDITDMPISLQDDIAMSHLFPAMPLGRTGEWQL